MLDNQLDKDQMRERVQNYVQRNKQVTRWTMFALNIFMFLLFMALSWGIALGTPSIAALFSEPKSPILALLILPTVGWGLAIFFHLMSMLVDTGAMEKSFQRRAMTRLMGEQLFSNLMAQAGLGAEKPKRDSKPMRLGDDGELVADDEAASDDIAPRKKMAGKS